MERPLLHPSLLNFSVVQAPLPTASALPRTLAPTCPPARPCPLQVSRVHKAGSGTPAGLPLKPAAGPKKADYVYYDNIQ